MNDNLRNRLKIPTSCLDEINALLLDPDTRAVNDFMAVIEKYGTPEEINRKAKEARSLPNLMAQLQQVAPAYVEDLKWLEQQRDNGAFISISDYRRKILGDEACTGLWLIPTGELKLVTEGTRGKAVTRTAAIEFAD